MIDDRWTPGEAELTNELRAMYAAPTDESYWDSLEARILAHRLEMRHRKLAGSTDVDGSQ